MIEHDELTSETSLLFMGESSLADGFQLIGFETLADPKIDAMEAKLADLMEQQKSALVILDNRLYSSKSDLLHKIRAEGGRIILTKVPSLNTPEDFHFEVDEKVCTLLGETEKEEPSHGR